MNIRWYHFVLIILAVVSMIFAILYFTHQRIIYIDKPVINIPSHPQKPDTTYHKPAVNKPPAVKPPYIPFMFATDSVVCMVDTNFVLIVKNRFTNETQLIDLKEYRFLWNQEPEYADTLVSELTTKKDTLGLKIESFVKVLSMGPVETIDNPIRLDVTEFRENIKKEVEGQNRRMYWKGLRTGGEIALGLVAVYKGAKILRIIK